MQNVIKDISQIHHRLFDHTSAVQGEVKYFISEFEPKISKEFDQLLQISHCLNEANDVDAVENFTAAGGVDKINTKLDAVTAMLEKLVAKGAGKNNKSRDYLQQVSDEQSKELSKFIDEINEKRRRVDSDFEQKITELKDHLENLERQGGNQ